MITNMGREGINKWREWKNPERLENRRYSTIRRDTKETEKIVDQ